MINDSKLSLVVVNIVCAIVFDICPRVEYTFKVYSGYRQRQVLVDPHATT